MFRKRKTVAPYFRLPNPSNPVSGSSEYLHPPFKPYCRFVLTETLTTADESKKAVLTTPEQWGPGMHHTPDVLIHVHNLLSADDVTYVFSGGIGDIGFAGWDRDNHWRIVSMVSDSTGLVELCAQETATRNTPYTALLGTWSPDDNLWCYDGAPTVYAIDHRIGPPAAETGMKGLYQRMSSTVEAHNGWIYVCVSLDCEVPPEGCNLCEET